MKPHTYNEASYLYGEEIDFESLIDNEEMVGGPVIWTSDLDGEIGSKPIFKSADSSVGRHNIVASVKNKTGEESKDYLTLIVDKFTWASHYKI